MNERIQRLVDFILSESIYPEPHPVSYDRADLLLPDTVMQTKRICQYLVSQDVKIHPDSLLAGQVRFNCCPYPSDFMLKTGLVNIAEMIHAFFSTDTPLEGLKFFGHQHASGDFGKIIDIGITGLKVQIDESLKKYKGDKQKEEFLQNCHLMCDGILAWEDKCADACAVLAAETDDPSRREELMQMERNLRRVPRYPAETFYEAVQSMYFCYDFIPNGIGVPDRWLQRFYDADLAAGKISKEFAFDLMQELYIKIQSYTSLKNQYFTRGGQSHFSLGGYTLEGEDGWTELSDLMLTALMDLPLFIPEVSFRWTKKTPYQVLYHVLDLERHDPNKRIALVSDDAKIESLMRNCNVPWEQAITYTTVGCNMISLVGGMWYGSGYSNQVMAVHNTLYKRTGDILKAESFDEFFDIYTEELHKVLLRCEEIDTRFSEQRAKDELVLSSLFMNGCIESGISMTKGGASGFSELGGGIGLVCTIDSLAMIRQFVYEEKTVTMREMLNALEANWEGYEVLRSTILNKGRFFGNNDPLSDEVAVRVTTAINEFAKNRTDMFGKHYVGVTAPGYRPYEKWFGSVIGATPDGRYSGTPFETIGIGQTNGKDRNGVTALLNSVAKCDPTRHFSAVTVTNINLDSAMIHKDENFAKTVHVIEAYFRNGGAQLQLNTVTKEELLAAKANPQKYQSLRVRVSGFSDFFVNMDDAMQNNLIKRTEISR